MNTSAPIPIDYLQGDHILLELESRWSERHRYWHGLGHLFALLDEITHSFAGTERDLLLLTALYHDAVYNPRASDNEEASAALLLQHAKDPHSSVIQQAAEIIRDSKWTCLPDSKLGRAFFEMDTRQLSDTCSLAGRLAYERAIFREYQWAPWPQYQEKRREFLRAWAEKFPQHRRGTEECMELLTALSPKIAVYPGSFHPFHLGHLSILRQAERAFDKVIVAVGVNRQKPGAVETLERRSGELQSQLQFHEVAGFGGLLSRFIEELQYPATVIRGVRDGTDLESELRYARFLNELKPQTSVVWIGCEPELQHLSSSAIRELSSIEPGSDRRYIPDTASIYKLTTCA